MVRGLSPWPADLLAAMRAIVNLNANANASDSHWKEDGGVEMRTTRAHYLCRLPPLPLQVVDLALWDDDALFAQSGFKLWSAVTTQGSEGIASEAFGVHPHEHGLLQGIGITLDQGDMFRTIQFVAISNGLKVPESTGHLCMGETSDETFVVQPVSDQVRNADQFQAPTVGIGPQLGQPGHRAVDVLYFADHT